MPEITADKRWHIDRRVPIGIIITFSIAILAQTAVLSSFIGRLDTRVAQLETAQGMRSDERDRLVTLEVQMRAIHESLLRIERRMDRDDRPGNG